jgi:NAD+ synthase (glutamine-hydrolysing)
VPKTLIQHLIRFVVAEDLFGAATHAVLERILATEISPELVPVGAGEEPQSTQAVIGPYELLDFFLFYVLRYGFTPSRVAFLAVHAWGDRALGGFPPGFPRDAQNQYDLPTIKHWLRGFIARFFGSSQFKRSALPNGPKMVAGGSLSPRGDWRAPSDGNARIWLEELEAGLPPG